MKNEAKMKEQILYAVESLITTKGVNNFSLRDVALAVGISTGTLYYYFKTKDDIVLAIIESHFNELSKDYDEWLTRHREKGDLTKERFIEVVVYKGTELFNRSKIHMYLVNECMRSNDILKERYLNLLHEWIEKLVDGVKQVYGPAVDARGIAYLISLVVEGMTIKVVLNDRAKDEEASVKELLKRL